MTRDSRRWVLLAGSVAVVLLAVVGVLSFIDLGGSRVPDPEDPAIAYSTRPTTDRIAAMNREIEAGRLRLKFDGDQGYLRSVLDALHIPIESQVAVFSKTSLQGDRINPNHPRTLFFNDSVAVGWVPGGFIEVAAQDPRQGVIFYTLDQKPVNKPHFARRYDCLTCHYSNDALGVPRMLLRSDFTAADGRALPQLGNNFVDDRTPFEKRWGGWYVTGTSGAMKHLGNQVVTDASNPHSPITEQRLNLVSLRGKFNTDVYLSPYSDIVALMVFDHQVRMMNLLTRIGWQARYASQSWSLRNVFGHGLDATAQEVVDYMFFVDEAPLPSKIEGTSGFAEMFSAEGPRDSRGRSLRQLDLERRLMRYPCSYMIYSDVFDALPPQAKSAIYAHMWDVLSGKVMSTKYARLSLADRQAIVEILRDTKPGLPDYFRPVTP